jgi:anaerobic selenocysteine-containing dehydrogenase
LNIDDARGRGIVDGDAVIVENGDFQIEVQAEVNGQARLGIGLLRGTRSISGPIQLNVVGNGQ